MFLRFAAWAIDSWPRRIKEPRRSRPVCHGIFALWTVRAWLQHPVRDRSLGGDRDACARRTGLAACWRSQRARLAPAFSGGRQRPSRVDRRRHADVFIGSLYGMVVAGFAMPSLAQPGVLHPAFREFILSPRTDRAA